MDEQHDPDADDGDGIATVVRPTQTPEKAKKRHKIPKYHVLLWDDEHHSFEYVIRMLKELFGHPEEKGSQLAKTVDSEGRVVVLTTTKEHAELKCEQIHAYGKDVTIAECAGSMTSTIEESDA